jgi:hypothetical protein
MQTPCPKGNNFITAGQLTCGEKTVQSARADARQETFHETKKTTNFATILKRNINLPKRNIKQKGE